jgi:hypothetical protein
MQDHIFLVPYKMSWGEGHSHLPHKPLGASYPEPKISLYSYSLNIFTM